MIKTVKKRNGYVAHFNQDKIMLPLKEACRGLLLVNANDVMNRLETVLYDGISTTDIQKLLIQAANSLISSETPNYTFVAARLLLFDMYHRMWVYTKTKKPSAIFTPTDGIGFCSAKDCYNNVYYEMFDYKNNEMVPLSKYNKYGDIMDIIDPSLDMMLTYPAVISLEKRYLKHDKGMLAELPQHMFLRIANIISSDPYTSHNKSNLKNQFITIYNMLATLKFLPGTPTISNSGRVMENRENLSSCFVGKIQDSLDHIYESIKTIAKVSKNGGGLGYDITSIRARGSSIAGVENASGGIIPFIKPINDTVIAVDQLGTRKGSITLWLQIWHLDLQGFLDLRKNSGDDRERAHDVFTGLWIPDLFMERLEKDDYWTLFCPKLVQDYGLEHKYGVDFKNAYIQAERDFRDNPRVQRIKAKEIWIQILTRRVEDGCPFLGFKDTVSVNNPAKDSGTIYSANLCTEILQNTKSDEDSEIMAVCNLASIDLGKVWSYTDIQLAVESAITLLSAVLVRNAQNNICIEDKGNSEYRAIGLGVMGEAVFLYNNSLSYKDDKTIDVLDNIYRAILFNALRCSVDERIRDCEIDGLSLYQGDGEYRLKSPLYKNNILESVSKYWASRVRTLFSGDKQIIKLFDEVVELDVNTLVEDLQNYGVNHGYLLAIAPTSSISVIANTTQGIEPLFKKSWEEENKFGITKIVPTYMSHHEPETAYDVNIVDLVKLNAVRSLYIDQGVSFNMFVDPDRDNPKDIHNAHLLAYKSGVKTLYYIRSKSPETEKKDFECVGCQ